MRKIATALLAASVLAGIFAASPASAGQDRRLYGDTYGYGARSAKYDPFTDGARMGKYDPYTDGARQAGLPAAAARCLDTDRTPL